jgi:hypothetical protein
VKSIKTLALAAVAALAVTAFVGVSSASATQFNAEFQEYPLTVNGTQTEAHYITVNFGTWECKSSSFSGELGEASETLTVSPQLSACTFLNVSGTAWQMDGCEFQLGAAGTFGITGCNGEGPHYEILGCRVTILPQTGRASIEYQTIGAEEEAPLEVLASAHISGLKYTQKGGWCANEAGTFSNGQYRGPWRISAQDEFGEARSLWVE